MKKIIYFCLISFLTIFFSCHKENWWFPDSKVFGKCTDMCTGLPLANIRIELWGGRIKDKSNSVYNKKIRTVYTESDGYYEIKFAKSENDNWLQMDGQSYVPINLPSPIAIKNKNDTEINFTLANGKPKIAFYLNIIDTIPSNNNDHININITEPNSCSTTQTYIHHISYYGHIPYNSQTINVYGNSPYKVKLSWAVTKNNITTYFSDSIVYTLGQPFQYSINY